MKLVLISLAALISLGAHANDGGIPYVKVEELKANVRNGEVLSIRGGEAFKLYEALPQDYVFDVTRSLTITDDDRSVNISCAGEPIDANASNPVYNPAKVSCSITVGKSFKPEEEESWVWAPQCKQSVE